MSDDDRPKTFSLHELAAGDGRFSCTRKQLAAWLLNAGIVTSRSGDLLTLTEHGRAMVREVGPGLRLEALHPDDDTHHERSRTASTRGTPRRPRDEFSSSRCAACDADGHDRVTPAGRNDPHTECVELGIRVRVQSSRLV